MLTTHIVHQILNGLVGRYECTIGASAMWIGLSSTLPNPDGTGVTEPPIDVNGYKRSLIGYEDETYAKKFGEPVDRGVENKDIIYFNESTGPWLDGTQLKYFVIFNSQTSTDPSNVVAYEELKDNGVASPITVTNANTVVLFREGALKIHYAE